MKILAFDYGDVRTGVALCDKEGLLASPLTVITESYAPKLADKIVDLVNEHRPEMLVMGLPKNMDGSEGFRAEKCRNFAALLEEKTNLKVELVDERLTTVSAHKALNFTNTRGEKRKRAVDALSAVFILEAYLQSNK